MLKLILIGLISSPVYAHESSRFEELFKKWEHILEQKGERWIGEKWDKLRHELHLSLTQCVKDFEKNLKLDKDEAKND